MELTDGLIETIVGATTIIVIMIGGLISMNNKQSRTETNVKSQGKQIDTIVIDIEKERDQREEDRKGLYKKMDEVKDKIDMDIKKIGTGLTRVETKINTLINNK